MLIKVLMPFRAFCFLNGDLSKLLGLVPEDVLMPFRAFCFLNLVRLQGVELHLGVLMPFRAFCFLNRIRKIYWCFIFYRRLNALSGILFFKLIYEQDNKVKDIFRLNALSGILFFKRMRPLRL